MIAPQILVLSLVFSIIWGLSLYEAVLDYGRARDAKNIPNADPTRRRLRTKAVVRALRTVMMAFALFTTSAAYLLRTSLVLAGESDNTAGLVTFYALLGVNLVAGLYCAVSLRYD